MRLAATTRAVGLALARDLPAKLGSFPLLRAGAVVSEAFARTLVDRHGVHAVWVDDELSAGIEPEELLPPEVRDAAAVTVARSLDAAAECFAHRRALPHALVDELAGIVARVVDCLVEEPAAATALLDLAAADEYTHRHSVDVMALGLLLGREHLRRHGWTDWSGRRRFDGLDQRLHRFGLGLILHDVGKAAIPPEVLNKPGRLSEEEWRLVRTHPTAGAAMLPGTVSPLVLATIRQHHERWDGAGYPSGIAGERIHPFARIAAVADVYDAITSERPYKRAAPPREAFDAVVAGSAAAFDPAVVDTFRRIVLPHPVGTEVELPDGRIGVVATVDRARPDAPTVRVLDGGTVIEIRVDARAPATA